MTPDLFAQPMMTQEEIIQATRDDEWQEEMTDAYWEAMAELHAPYDD